jgi:hypothetical protein
MRPYEFLLPGSLPKKHQRITIVWSGFAWHGSKDVDPSGVVVGESPSCQAEMVF